MTYTEVKEINRKKYYYRVLSVRIGKKVSKKREYLGVNLNKRKLGLMEKEADKKLVINKKNKELEKIKKKIKKVLEKNKIKRAGIFGSYAREEQKEGSDVDILVEADDKNMSLLDFVNIKLELQDNLGKNIDLVEYKLIKPELKRRILSEEIRLI